MAASDEIVIWEGSPAQVTNLGVYILCGLLFWLVIPIFIALWKWMQLKCYRYKITTERIGLTQGVFTKRTDSIELYRVKDLTLIQPFFLRLFGLSDIVLSSSDRVTPLMTLHAVPDGAALREKIRANVERLRQEKRVREVDYAQEP
jgi:uncharacterized membrane protein YdbT with pleckstrin-like domain